VTRLPSAKVEKQKIVIMAHIDSHRTPLLFSSPFWVKVLKMLVPAGILFSVISVVAIVINVSSILIIPLIFFCTLVLLMGQADLTPYTTGANDNASGVATLIGLASLFIRQPLAHTTIYFVVSGCEEVGSYGSRAFVDKYKPEIGNCYWLTLDGLSAQKSQLAIIGAEKFFLEVKSDPELIAIANKVVKEQPTLKAFFLPIYQGAYTDSSPAGLAGFKVLSFLALRPDSVLPAWHTLGDNYSSIDRHTLTNCFKFTTKFLREFDLAKT
jgi:Zn-dependent M28 family amino/carboxypeptidase